MEVGLTCEAMPDYTWASADDTCRVVLKCCIWKSRSGELHRGGFLEQLDPTLDHAGVRAILDEEGIGEMPAGGPAASRPYQARQVERREREALTVAASSTMGPTPGSTAAPQEQPWTGPNRLPCHVHCKYSE